MTWPSADSPAFSGLFVSCYLLLRYKSVHGISIHSRYSRDIPHIYHDTLTVLIISPKVVNTPKVLNTHYTGTPLCNTPSETLPGDIFVSLRTTFPISGTHFNTKFDPTNISLPGQLIWFSWCPMTIGLRDSLE